MAPFFSLFLTRSVRMSLANLVLLLKPTVSHDKDDESQDKTSCSSMCSLVENKSEARLLKKQVFSSSCKYLISSA